MSSEVKGISESVLQVSELASRSRKPAVAADSNSAQRSNVGAVADSVELTATVGRLQALEKSLETVPVVDAQRVDALRKSIADGSFRIDPERVATKLVQLEGTLDKVTASYTSGIDES